MEQFNYRIGNIEARTMYRREAVEIVQWEVSSCFVIVSFMQNGDPLLWKAVFESTRPFNEHVNWKHLRQLIQACYDFLGGKWNIDE